MVCLGNEQRSFYLFEIVSKYCVSDFFVDYDGYSISSKGLFPALAGGFFTIEPPGKLGKYARQVKHISWVSFSSEVTGLQLLV